MSEPLTGHGLASFDRLVSDGRQDGTLYLIDSADLRSLYEALLAAGVTGVTIGDLGNRPQYWLLKLAIHNGGASLDGNVNRLLSNWKQYGTIMFIGPDDINTLFEVMLSADIDVDLE